VESYQIGALRIGRKDETVQKCGRQKAIQPNQEVSYAHNR